MRRLFSFIVLAACSSASTPPEVSSPPDASSPSDGSSCLPDGPPESPNGHYGVGHSCDGACEPTAYCKPYPPSDVVPGGYSLCAARVPCGGPCESNTACRSTVCSDAGVCL